MCIRDRCNSICAAEKPLGCTYSSNKLNLQTIYGCTYSSNKREYMDTQRLCESAGISFVPLIAEADGGGWGGEAHKVFKELAKLKSSLTGELETTCALQIQQSLNLVLHRENARAILRRHPFLHHEDCLHTVLSAATTIQLPV